MLARLCCLIGLVGCGGDDPELGRSWATAGSRSTAVRAIATDVDAVTN